MTRFLRMLLYDRRVIQIAGIEDDEEARMLSKCGVDLIGFPLRFSRGTADTEAETAARIIHEIRPPSAGVFITYLKTADAVLLACRRMGASVVQLHGGIAVDEMRRLREIAPDLSIVKTLVVRGQHAGRLTAEVDRLVPYVDAFLTDTFDHETGKWGATGKTHDWSVSRRVVEYSARPVILAGGLNPSNVARAILEVGPAGVDVHTGVEGERGRKDPRLVQKFVEEARKAFERM